MMKMRGERMRKKDDDFDRPSVETSFCRILGGGIGSKCEERDKSYFSNDSIQRRYLIVDFCLFELCFLLFCFGFRFIFGVRNLFLSGLRKQKYCCFHLIEGIILGFPSVIPGEIL